MVWPIVVGVVLGLTDVRLLAALMTVPLLAMFKSLYSMALRPSWFGMEAHYSEWLRDNEQKGTVPRHPKLYYLVTAAVWGLIWGGPALVLTRIIL